MSSSPADQRASEQSRACERFLLERLPQIREAARRLGYAIAVHGSASRDVDLVAVPWVEGASSPEELIGAIRETLGWNNHLCGGKQPEERPHGRLGWSIWFGGVTGTYLDVSVMPRAPDAS